MKKRDREWQEEERKGCKRERKKGRKKVHWKGSDGEKRGKRKRSARNKTEKRAESEVELFD